jgi:energy-converting hydrogenase Eha subunit G
MTNGETKNVATGAQNDQFFKHNVTQLVSYMRFVGILEIIYGALLCVFIIYAIIGIPVIFIGVRMREAAVNFEKYAASGDFNDLANAIERQKRFFFILYVLNIIGLILMGIGIIVLIGVLAANA